MLNEIEEFKAYTGKIEYKADNKFDSTYLGRFTYDMLLKFTGLSRVLTIIARGYMYENGQADIDRARRALCAWCSVPDSKNAHPKKDGQSETDYRSLHDEFPELVDDKGKGWFYRHVHHIIKFVLKNPDKVMKSSVKNCELLKTKFNSEWRKKLMQYQVPLFSVNTKGAWITRFDDILADALEQGELRNKDFDLPKETLDMLIAATPKGVPETVLPTLAKYYLANKQEDSEWVVLPVTNFDAYFGTTAFGRKWLNLLPENIIERDNTSYGISRYTLNDKFIRDIYKI